MPSVKCGTSPVSYLVACVQWLEIKASKRRISACSYANISESWELGPHVQSSLHISDRGWKPVISDDVTGPASKELENAGRAKCGASARVTLAGNCGKGLKIVRVGSLFLHENPASF